MGYFCGAMTEGSDAIPPKSAHGFPAGQNAQARADALAFIQDRLWALWPAAFSGSGPARSFRWELLALLMGALLLFVLLRLVLRRDALAAAAVAAFVFVPAVLSAPEVPWFVAAMGGLWAVSWILLLLRFGMLAAIVGLFANDLLQWFPLTSDLTAWTSGPTVLAMALLSALALLSFRNAVGGTGLRRYLAPETSSRP